MNRFYKNFVVDIIIAVTLTVFGIVMLPVFGIGSVILDVFVCAALIAYLVLFRLDKLKKAKGVIFILTATEFALVGLIAIGLVLKQFELIKIDGVCSTVGLILWLRGVTDAVSHYIAVTGARRGKRNVPQFILDLLLISVGVLMVSRKIISDNVLNWSICVIMMLTGLVFAALAVLFHPGKKSDGN